MYGQATLHRSSIQIDCCRCGWPVSSLSGRTLRCLCRHRRALGPCRQHDRHCPCQTAGWGHTLPSDRGIQRRDLGGCGGAKGHQPGRTGRVAAYRTRRLVRGQHGLAVPGSSWHDLQKKQRTQPSRSGPTSRSGAGPGLQPSLTLTRSGSCSSTRPAHRPRWPGCEAVLGEATAVAPRSRTGTGRRRPLRGHFAWMA